jgi:hypothetical protein
MAAYFSAADCRQISCVSQIIHPPVFASFDQTDRLAAHSDANDPR